MKHLMPVFSLLFLLLGCELFMSEPPEGKTHHLAIALSYENTDIRQLYGTIPDAVELKKAFTALFWEKDHASTLMIQDGSDDLLDPLLPTKEHVLTTIEALSESMDEQDILIISYSGHGWDDGSLVLYPPRENGTILDGNKSPMEDSIVSVDELYASIDSCKGSVLLLVDSCYSGNFVKESETSYSLIERNIYLKEIYEQYFTEGDYAKPVFVLAATTYDNTAGEASFHGYFTKALLAGLGWDEEEQVLRDVDQIISVDYLYEYVYHHQDIALSAMNSWEYQHPTITGGSLDLILR